MNQQLRPAAWLLLHGTPLSPRVWDAVASALSDSGAEVFCPSLRISPDDQDVQAAVASRVALKYAGHPGGLHVVGHSFGGQVAIDLALCAPGLVRSLTIICSRDTPYPAFATAAAALRGDGAVNVDAALKRWFRPDEIGSDAPVVDYARRCLQDADRTDWARALDAIATYDRSGGVNAVGVPVTLVAAELDQVSTPRSMQDLALRLPQSRLHVLPGAAHMSAFIDSAGLTELVRGTHF